ncbi:hypothetical protein L6R29_26090, partial [Myxococcota bacterium]|nr:hypothetical protein [Myxococcota bacterium]
STQHFLQSNVVLVRFSQAFVFAASSRVVSTMMHPGKNKPKTTTKPPTAHNLFLVGSPLLLLFLLSPPLHPPDQRGEVGGGKDALLCKQRVAWNTH